MLHEQYTGFRQYFKILMLFWLLNVNTLKEVGMKKCMVDSLKKVHAIFHVDRGVKKVLDSRLIIS